MANALGYLRISEDRTGLAAGVTRQREATERRARERGWTWLGDERDNDRSAKAGSRKRDGFESMLRRIDSGEVQVVVAWSLDRLQRSRRDEVRLYELCQAKGVTISLVNGADLDLSTAGGRLVADQLSSVARYEIELKSDRQKAAQAQAAQAGRRVGGRRPFGYAETGMTVREDEAAAVYAGYRAILSGEPVAEVARMWNDKGFQTGQGRPFTRSSARDVLLNPRNAALRSHVSEDDRRAANGSRVYRDGHITGPAAWPPIVDEGTWRAAVDLLRDPSRRTAAANARGLLTGVARCAVCGLSCHGGGATKGQGRIIRCPSMKHVQRSAEPVEDYVSAVVIERLSRPDAIGLLADNQRPDVGKLREQAVALRTRLDALAVEFADGALTASQLRAATERLRERLAAAEAELADAGRVDVLGPLVHAENVRAAWDALSVARRRAVIDLLMTVRLHPPGRGTRTFRPETVVIERKEPL
ncbi:recombinase family protein [Geodermatophilus sp. URMC 62]|uniref:recombinase family protein n=1 Tax=Geodermatophilus sp. URMC 62 TaxID=3423414 RepID=UPI00406C483E